MSTAPAADDIAAHTYVLLTTFRRTGEPVGTPVWIVRDGERLLVTTGGESGKVTRIAHTSRVTLTPCDMRGFVEPAAHEMEATAIVDESPETRAVLENALREKYGEAYHRVRAAAPRTRTSVALVIAPV